VSVNDGDEEGDEEDEEEEEDFARSASLSCIPMALFRLWGAPMVWQSIKEMSCPPRYQTTRADSRGKI
jgi:hypothetical protein